MSDINNLERLLNAFPAADLAHLPTALDALPRLRDTLQLQPRLWVKRDDCTGLALGGNKARQLMYYLGDALSQGADCVMSTGAVQSNYMRSLAAAAAKLGLHCVLQLESRVPLDDTQYAQSGNVFLNDLFGAELVSYPQGEDENGADDRLYELANAKRAAGYQPYVIPLGMHHAPLGALGYIAAAAELLGQCAAKSLSPSHVFIGSGSGLTHAGLLWGLRYLGSEIDVVGVCVRRDREQQRQRILHHLNALDDLLGQQGSWQRSDVRCIDDTLAPGYGLVSTQTHEVLHQVARCEGLLVDPVYSAKVFAGALLQMQKWQSAKAIQANGDNAVLDVPALDTPTPNTLGQDVIIWHTGGVPALFAYQNYLQNYPTAEQE